MISIGSHLSTSGGFKVMGETALKLGATTFAFFTRNPRGGQAKAIDPADADSLRTILSENGFGRLVAHAPYTMNICAEKPDIRAFSEAMLADDLKRMEYLPGNFYNFHPGSHVGQGFEAGIEMISAALNRVLSPDMHTTVLLETMAGKGSEVGRSFEELRAIIDRVELKDKLGVCFDTCHVFDGGYDIVNSLEEVLGTFDSIIGLDKLCAVHINDSMNTLGSHKDRHACIGEGNIGAEALRRIVCHPAFDGKPFILETPNDDEGYKKEIALIRSWNRSA